MAVVVISTWRGRLLGNCRTDARPRTGLLRGRSPRQATAPAWGLLGRSCTHPLATGVRCLTVNSLKSRIGALAAMRQLVQRLYAAAQIVEPATTDV